MKSPFGTGKSWSYDSGVVLFPSGVSSLLELCKITRKTHLGLVKAGLMLAKWSYFRVISIADLHFLMILYDCNTLIQ